MKKIIIAALVSVGLVFPVSAQKLELEINNIKDPRSINIESFNYDGSTLSIKGNTGVSPPYVPPVVDICGPLPPNVVIKPQLPNSQITVSSNTTNANQIHAYPFNSGAWNSSITVIATRVNLGEGKTIVVSECPGRVDIPVMKNCSNWNTESTMMPIVTTTSIPRTNCSVQANKTYYINVKNSRGYLGNEPPFCTNNCGYYIYKR